MPSLTKVQPAFILAQGAIELDSGTASAPSLKFATSSSTGMFSPSTGALAFSTGSTQNALTILSGGNVGIGTTNPVSKLSIGTSGTDRISIDWIGSGGPYAVATIQANMQSGEVRMGAVNTAGTHFVTLYSNNSEALRILSSGNIGIGTTNPTSKLHVSGGDLHVNSLDGDNVDIKLSVENNNNFSIIRSIRASDSQSILSFNINNGGLKEVAQFHYDEGLYVKGTGDGTTAGNAGLITFSDQSGTRLAQITSYKTGVGDNTDLIFSTYDENSFRCSEKLRITSTGNVGVGTDNPTSKLDVAGTVTATNFADATGGYNVNLGSNSIEGRGLVAGYSGGSYGGIGYNVRHTTTGGVWIAPSTDTSSYLLFNSAGFTFYGAGSGVAGRTLSYTGLATLNSSGNLSLTGTSHTAGGNTIWHAGNDGAGSGLDADLLDGQNGTYYRQAWQSIDAGTRLDYSLGFQPPTSGYAGFYFSKSTSGATTGDAGYLLVRGTSDNDIYTAEGITLVADAGWLTLAQRTTSSRGVRIMSGTTSAERLKITTAGDIQFLNGNSLTYNGNTIWHSANDGAGSGLDADLLDGLSSGSFIQTPGSTSQMISGNINGAVNPDNVTINGIQYCTSVSLLGQTDGALYSQAYSSSWIGQIFQDYRTGQLALRGKNSGTWQPWRTNWDSGNDGAGSGLDADLLDGLDLHTGRNNEANKVVRTDGNGYIQAGWINTISGNLGVTARLDRVYTSNDGYIRYLSLTDFKNQMGLSSKNSYSRAVDYTSNSDYWVGSFGHSGYGANETFHGGSGFFDIWGGTNYPSGFTHIHGINMLHYTTNSLGSTGGVAYGWQLTTQYDSDAGPYWRRCNAGSFSNWRKIWHDTNDGAGSGLDADLLDGNNSSYFLDTSSTTQTKTGRLNIHGDFLVAVNGTTANHIVQRPYTINNGTLSWEGSAGQLFSITNNLTAGSIFSVNDVSGIPSIDVDADGTVRLAPFNGTVVVKQVTETSVNNFNTTLAPSSGTLTIDVSVGTVILGDLNASVNTWAFTNVPTTNNRATTITLIIDGDTSQTYGEACSVNGSTIVGGVKWPGGNAPVATNGFDIISFTIVRDGAGTINVFGSGNTNLAT